MFPYSPKKRCKLNLARRLDWHHLMAALGFLKLSPQSSEAERPSLGPMVLVRCQYVNWTAWSKQRL